VPLLESSLILMIISFAWKGYFDVTSRRFVIGITCVAGGLFAVHVPGQLAEYGSDAARDFLSVVDLYFVVGGALISSYLSRSSNWENFVLRFTRVWLLAATFYSLTQPFGDFLKQISPTGVGLNKSIPILGYYLSTPLTAAAGLFTLLLMRPSYLLGSSFIGRSVLALLGAAWAYFLLAGQGRGIMGAILFCVPLLFVLGYSRYSMRFSSWLLVGITAILVFPMLGVEIQGRIGSVNIDTFTNRFASVVGAGTDESGIEGVHQRADWWGKSLELWQDSTQSVVLGVGYGPALTDFVPPGGGVVREPHNSYISALTRGGVFYLLAWGTIVLWGFLATLKLSRMQRRSRSSKVVLMYALLMFVMLVVAFVEPLFETPALASIFYFWSGFFIARLSYVKRQLARSTAYNGLAMRRLYT
jgi:O-antigen ligase